MMVCPAVQNGLTLIALKVCPSSDFKKTDSAIIIKRATFSLKTFPCRRNDGGDDDDDDDDDDSREQQTHLPVTAVRIGNERKKWKWIL